MSATKRPPPKGPDRPMLRSSHGGRAKKPPPATPRRDEPATPPRSPARTTRGPNSRGDSAMKKTRATVPAGVSTASDEARDVAIIVAVAGIEKKASGLEVIDVAGKVDYADFLVLMSGRSDRHVTALASAIEEALRKKNKRALAVEGLPHASWVLMDFGDVVVHVFQDDARATYDIDSLWMDARRVPVPISDPRPE
jgi:ribosome-associated protein